MDDNFKQKRIEEYLLILKESINARTTYILQTSSVIAIMISILSISNFFNQSSFITSTIKIMLSIFVFMIPLSLFLYLYEINNSWNIAKINLEKETNQKLPEEKRKLIDSVCVFFPWIFLILLSISVILMVIFIWI
jgi:hypothetical protein